MGRPASSRQATMQLHVATRARPSRMKARLEPGDTPENASRVCGSRAVRTLTERCCVRGISGDDGGE
ncbi:hypothetical protein LZ30DRAFT_719787 [Colletotrichum cereale]|nr:hypothetical protein LZ30DRAFT_719787 [Colletotrichum cereale]